MNFIRNLVYLRRRRGMTQQDLADKMGTTRNQISRWETGARVPDLNDIILLCLVLGVTPNELLC